MCDCQRKFTTCSMDCPGSVNDHAGGALMAAIARLIWVRLIDFSLCDTDPGDGVFIRVGLYSTLLYSTLLVSHLASASASMTDGLGLRE
jgi:hypothetical protein